MKKLVAVVLLVACAGCAPQFSDATMALFPVLESNTEQAEQSYRVAWKDKIRAGLKDGPDRAVIEQYLEVHGTQLAGIRDVAKSLNTAIQAQKK